LEWDGALHILPTPERERRDILIMARTQSFEKPISLEGCWIKYQLNLRNIRLDAVAKKVRCSVATVSRVIFRKRRSEKVEAALAEVLGYPSWKDLWAAAFCDAERRAV
jgi:hypothetical protein